MLLILSSVFIFIIISMAKILDNFKNMRHKLSASDPKHFAKVHVNKLEMFTVMHSDVILSFNGFPQDFLSYEINNGL